MSAVLISIAIRIYSFSCSVPECWKRSAVHHSQDGLDSSESNCSESNAICSSEFVCFMFFFIVALIFLRKYILLGFSMILYASLASQIRTRLSLDLLFCEDNRERKEKHYFCEHASIQLNRQIYCSMSTRASRPVDK
jgi:hypothetical protein